MPTMTRTYSPVSAAALRFSSPVAISSPLPALERPERDDERERRHGQEEHDVARIEQPTPEARESRLETHVAKHAREPTRSHDLGEIVHEPERAEHDHGHEECDRLAFHER